LLTDIFGAKNSKGEKIQVKFFITGATGFIGSHLCRRLLAEGNEVSALIRSPNKAKELVRQGMKVVPGDLASLKDPAFKIPECDVVVHLAGVVNAQKLSDYDEINFRAVADLVECLKRQSWKPKRLVFASSLAAAGPAPYDSALTEKDPPAPIDHYGRAKYAAEKVVAAAPFPTTSFRPALVFGPHDPATLTIYKSAQTGIGMSVFGKPQRISFVDVADAVEAIILMCKDASPGHKTYFLAHPTIIDMNEMWKTMSDVLGKKVFMVPMPRTILYCAMQVGSLAAAIFGFTTKLDKKQYLQMTAPAFTCSSEALMRDLGWKPTRSFKDSIECAVAGYCEAGDLARRAPKK
jgi:nucleoside-diphosphate-sugar epimerase